MWMWGVGVCPWAPGVCVSASFWLVAGLGAHWWRELLMRLWPSSPSGPLLGDVTSDLSQLMTSSMLAAVCLGLNEPWDHEMTAFFRFKPWCPSLCLQEEVNLGSGEVGLFSLMEGWPLPWVRFPPHQSKWGGHWFIGGHPLYFWTPAMNNLQFTEMLANCHKPVSREESHQMFIYEEFLNKTNLMGRIRKNFHYKFEIFYPVL